MNNLDLVITVILVLFVLFGFFKKFYRNIFAVLITIVAFPVGVLLEKTYYSTIMSANISVLTDRTASGSILHASNINGIIDNIKSNSVYNDILNYSPTMRAMADNYFDIISKLLVTFIIILLIILLSGIMAYIIGAVFGIFIGKRGRKKKLLLVSIPLSFIRGCAVAVLVLLPVIFIKPSLEACKDSNNDAMKNAYSFYTNNIEGSQFLATFETQLKDIFIDDEVTVNGVDSNASEEIGKGISLYNKLEPLLTSFSQFNTATPTEYNALLEEIKLKVNIADLEFVNLGDDSNFKKVIIEFINSGLEQDDSGMFINLSFDVDNVTSLKEDVFPSIMVRAFNELLEKSGINIILPDGMTYNELMTEISNTNKMYLASLELAKIQNADDLNSIDTVNVVDALKSFKDSEFTTELIEKLASEYVGDNSGVGVALSNISPETMASEADDIGQFITILKGESRQTPSEMIDTVAKSTVSLELLKATNVSVPLTSTEYDEAMAKIDTKEELSLEDRAALKTMFSIASE